MNLKTEIWKDIEGYEGLYEVSNLGRVRNVKSGRILKQYVHERNGYLQVSLYKEGKQKKMRTHRAVAMAFIENDNPLEKDQVNHIDCNKTNNCVDNLEWCSCQDNIRHAYDNNLHTKKNKIRRVKCIELNTIYSSASEASRKLEIDASSILDVCKGKFKTMKGLHFEYVD